MLSIFIVRSQFVQRIKQRGSTICKQCFIVLFFLPNPVKHIKRAVTCDFQQCGILTSVDSDEHVLPPFKLRTSKRCSASSLTLIEYLSD